jgi:DNA-binding transcriptional LysR family regulator
VRGFTDAAALGRRPLHWDDVRYFLVLARTGSLSAAARQLRVEHSTVARRVTALEQVLAVRLFDRLPRGWLLTPGGKDLVESAQKLEAGALALERVARGSDGTSRKVRLSAPPAIVTHFLIPHLRPLTEQHAIDLELASERGGANLVRGEAEIALRIGPSEVPPGIIVRGLGQVGYGLYATAEHAARPAGERVFVGFDDTMRGAAQKQWLDEHAGARRCVLRSNDLLALYLAAKQGYGIALLPHLLVTAQDRLVRLALAEPALERPFSLLVHPDVRRSRHVKIVIDFVVRLARTHEAWFRAPAVPASRARRAPSGPVRR